MSRQRFWHKGIGLAVALVVGLAGCGSTQDITQTPFQRSASDAASLVAAASATLQLVHAEPARMTVEYGAGSMINFADRLSSIPEELPTLSGAPDQETLAALAALLDKALEDVEHPCLLPACDWQTQISDLDAAGAALREAVE